MKKQQNWLFILIITLVACHTQSQRLSKEETEHYLSEGKSITQSAFAALSQAVKKEIIANGSPSAIGYCNLKASSIVDSLSQVHHVQIKRTSSRLRNPDHAPSAHEQAILTQYERDASRGQAPTPLLARQDDKVIFNSPIHIVAPLCLKCHGDTKTIQPNVKEKLEAIYPQDQATGYALGELRGIWTVTFDLEE